jgi:hypothetical protein
MIMRNLIIFLSAFWLVSNGFAQATYQDLVPCAPNVTQGTPWDWRQPIFTAYVNYPINQGISVISPFFASGSSFNNNNIDFYSASTGEGRDFRPEDGWELIQKDFGQSPTNIPNDPLEFGIYIENPYFILYNKYTSVLRVFILMVKPKDSDGRALIEIGFTNSSPKTATLDLLSGKPRRNALDERIDFPFSPDQPTITIGNEYVTTSNYWITADFPMNYDPCICNAQSRLFIKVWILQSSNLTFKTTSFGLR